MNVSYPSKSLILYYRSEEIIGTYHYPPRENLQIGQLFLIGSACIIDHTQAYI